MIKIDSQIPISIITMNPNPLIEQFYKSLSPAEKEAHTIAARMLGSSYIVDKTHAFMKWRAKQQQQQQASTGQPSK
jgi:hypothetical protein